LTSELDLMGIHLATLNAANLSFLT
jgi:hypothetical protein